jgi:hypothetical protein
LLNLNDCQAQIAKELLRLSNENINLTCENVELKRKCENYEQCGMGDKFSTLLMNIMLQAEAHEQYFNHFDLDDLAMVLVDIAHVQGTTIPYIENSKRYKDGDEEDK